MCGRFPGSASGLRYAAGVRLLKAFTQWVKAFSFSRALRRLSTAVRAGHAFG